MTVALAPLVMLLSTVTPLELEYRGTRYLVQEFEQAGHPIPEGDPTLAAAARALAREALTSDSASDILTITEAVSDARGWDPTPRALVLRGTPPGEALRALLGRTDLAERPASHLGLGAALDGDRAALVVLLTERRAEMEPFPRTVPRAGTAQTICGRLHPPLDWAEIYATQPSGRVTRVASSLPAERFCARVDLPHPGRYTVEVVGRGPSGPMVVALLFVDVGGRHERGKRARMAEPTTVPEARRVLVERINALRQAHDLQALERDDLLDKVAQAYSEQMARQGFFSHVGPEGHDIKSRLRGAGYLYKLAGENLGVASGPLAAHFGIEHSPGHRKNLLEPEYTKVGIGIAFQKLGEREQALVTELFAAPNREMHVVVNAQPRVDPSSRLYLLDKQPLETGAIAAAYRAAEEQRRALGHQPLQRSEVLELLAAEQARRSQELDMPLSELGSEGRTFARLNGLDGVSVSVARYASPDALEHALLTDPACGRVGVGALQDDARSGAGRGGYWIAVACAPAE